jgi:hypothetical protein
MINEKLLLIIRVLFLFLLLSQFLLLFLFWNLSKDNKDFLLLHNPGDQLLLICHLLLYNIIFIYLGYGFLLDYFCRLVGLCLQCLFLLLVFFGFLPVIYIIPKICILELLDLIITKLADPIF